MIALMLRRLAPRDWRTAEAHARALDALAAAARTRSEDRGTQQPKEHTS